MVSVGWELRWRVCRAAPEVDVDFLGAHEDEGFSRRSDWALRFEEGRGGGSMQFLKQCALGIYIVHFLRNVS